MFSKNLRSGLSSGVAAASGVAYVRYDAQRQASHLDIDGQSLVLREHGATLSAASPSPQLQPLVSALHGSAANATFVLQTLLDGAGQRAQLRPIDAAAECYRAVWPGSAGAAASAERAFVGLCDALQSLQRAALSGVRASAKDGNPFAWTVLLSDFPEHSRLQQDLAAYAAKFAPAGGAAVELELRWPSTFPWAPPELRVVRPMLEPHSGGVVAGAMVLPRWLSSRAWSATPPARALDDVGVGALLSAVRASFIYRYIIRESCSQFDSLPLTSLRDPVSRCARRSRNAKRRCASTPRRSTRFARGARRSAGCTPRHGSRVVQCLPSARCAASPPRTPPKSSPSSRGTMPLRTGSEYSFRRRTCGSSTP